MLRQPRLDIPDLLHHVMVRGIERRVILCYGGRRCLIALVLSARLFPCSDNTAYTDFVERLRRLLPVGR